MSRIVFAFAFAVTVAAGHSSQASGEVLLPESKHVRNGDEREWSEFSESAEGSEISIEFTAKRNAAEQTLEIRQQDVKQFWDVKINDKRIARLHRNENDITGLWPIPPDTLLDGSNTLTIATTSKTSDDVRIGPVVLHARPLQAVANQCQLRVSVTEKGRDEPLPCRITVVNSDGSLQTSGAESNNDLAVRPGVIYCRGDADFGVPPGRYTVFAGRGPEYGVAQYVVTLEPGAEKEITLSLRREVDTTGWVACDTHVHTFTHSRHGDATIEERMLTLAGEGIELPIATDHNIHIDYEQTARALNVRHYFTPVIGNEVTTKIGHFNVFPVASADTPIPDFKAETWDTIAESIESTPDVKVSILNHARDIHSGLRPFGPKHHLSAAARNLDGWTLRANAMELINSGAQQTDMMQLVHDWMGLLNAGFTLTPVGSSDSHDVARHFVGQGRTYIRCPDDNVGNIDVGRAVQSFVEGRVCVSCGLFVDVAVNNRYGPGDLVPRLDGYSASVTVAGPRWAHAERVELYANGVLVATEMVPEDDRINAGTKLVANSLALTKPSQDVFLVAVARGPGVRDLFWPIAKPYQPDSPDWQPEVMAISGAIWIDLDGDGKRTPAVEYARRVCQDTDYDTDATIDRLEARDYDDAVAIHAAALLHEHNAANLAAITRLANAESDSAVKRGFARYATGRRECELARLE